MMSMKIPDNKLREIEGKFKAMHEDMFRGERFDVRSGDGQADG